jgi:uncharacterized protein YcbX
VEIAELWRYPVKSLRGERLEEAELRPDGIAGDRLVQVVYRGQVVTSRVRPRLLGLHATLDGGSVSTTSRRGSHSTARSSAAGRSVSGTRST